MSDQSTTPDPTPTPTPDPTPAASTGRAPVRSTSSSDDRFAAYDTRLQRFVGGVHDTAKAAKDAAKARGVKAGDTDVRKV